jgi:hypothetical protein
MVRHWLSRAMLAAMLVVSAHALWAHRQLADMQREFEAAIGSRPDIPLRRVCLHPPAQRPARLGGNMAQHLAVYYMIDEGGVFPSVFRGRAEAHLLAETEHFDELIPPKLAPGPPELISQRLARQALYYDDVLVWDLPQELVDTMRGDGFEVAFQRGGITRLAPPLRHIQLTVTHAPAGLLNAGVFYGELKSPHADTPLSSAHDRARSARLAPLPAREVTLVLAQARGDAWRVIQERSVDLRNHDAVVTIDLQP